MKALLLILACLAPVGAAAQTLYVTETETGFLNLRDGPGTRHDVIGRLSPGDRVDVEESLGLWTKIRLPSGARGWVSGDYLARGEPAVTDLRFVGQTDAGYLNLRAGPGTTHGVLRRMYPGDRLEPLGRDGDWMRVRHVSGAEGWTFAPSVTR